MGELRKGRAVMWQWLSELLLSLNIALLIVLESSEMMSRLLLWDGRLQFWLNGHWHLPPESSVGGNVAFSTVALVYGVCILAFLRLLSLVSVKRTIPRWIGGITSLVALPVWWLHFTFLFPVPRGLANAPRILLFAEIAFAVFCAVLYVRQQQRLRTWALAFLLLLHFGLWGWLFVGGPWFWSAPFKLVFPLAGFLAVLTWGVYIYVDSPFMFTTQAGGLPSQS
jgi:hypothetical protein